MKYISLLLLTLIFIVQGCTNANQSEENLKKLDKVYGYCDNPQRSITGRQYEVCKAREDSAGPDGEIGEGKTISEIFSSITGNKNNNNGQVQVISAVNRELWRGAMEVLSPYSIKNIDSNVGYIETDWIYSPNIDDERCSIKVKILSTELVSNGVDVNFVCSKLINNNWVLMDDDFIDEEKRLHLKILENAQLSQSSNL